MTSDLERRIIERANARISSAIEYRIESRPDLYGKRRRRRGIPEWQGSVALVGGRRGLLDELAPFASRKQLQRAIDIVRGADLAELYHELDTGDVERLRARADRPPSRKLRAAVAHGESTPELAAMKKTTLSPVILCFKPWRDIFKHLLEVTGVALVTLIIAAHFFPATPLDRVIQEVGLFAALILPLGIVRGIGMALAPVPLAAGWLAVAPGDPLPTRTLITGGLLCTLAYWCLPGWVSRTFEFFDRRALARQLGYGGGTALIEHLARTVRERSERGRRKSRSTAQPQHEPLPLGADSNAYDALAVLGALWPELRYLVSCGFEQPDPITGAQRVTLRFLYGQADVLASGANWDELFSNLCKVDPFVLRGQIERSTSLLPRYAAHYAALKDSEECAREAARAKAAPPS